MKVIDLLNKIANNEEVPEYVRYENHLSLDIKDTMLVCKENLFFKLDQSEIYLNDEVEIIEEDKEIAKIDFRTLNTQKEKNRVMKDTINQLIDEINELKKGK